MKSRCFSLDEANALLPQLEILLGRLVQKKEAHEKLHDEHFMSELIHEAIKQKSGTSSDDSHVESASRLDGGITEILEEIDQIRAFGCILRSVERGWIEFPAERQGEVIYYCWKRGEAVIGYYRSAKNVFTERFPL